MVSGWRLTLSLPNRSIAGKWPILFALALAALMAASVTTSGLLSPADPQVAGNEGYRQLWLGRVAGSGGSLESFGHAVEADPAFPYRWSDLGEALLASGERDKARYCFDRAMELAPRDPQIRLRAANFHFRVGEVEQALRLDSMVLEQLPDYDETIFSSYIRMGGDIQRVLQTGIGSDARAAQQFYRFLTQRGDAGTLSVAWRWMEGRGFVTLPLALSRTSWLIGKDLPAEASAVWLRYAVPARSDYRKSNWIWNSGFENPWTGEGFDWRVEPSTGVEAGLDDQVAHAGRRALKIRFHAADNLDFHHVSQIVWLSPGRYRLSAWLRTQDLTTDQGVGLRILSARAGAPATALDASTAALTGTHDWTEVGCEFTVRAVSELARVQIDRRPSFKFDSKPQGTVWVDEVELKRVSD